MNTQEKSKVIAGKLGIEGELKTVVTEATYRDNVTTEINLHYPDFFKPENQMVLYDALFEDKNQRIRILFIYEFLASKNTNILRLQNENKLAELFYEFIESENSKC